MKSCSVNFLFVSARSRTFSVRVQDAFRGQPSPSAVCAKQVHDNCTVSCSTVGSCNNRDDASVMVTDSYLSWLEGKL